MSIARNRSRLILAVLTGLMSAACTARTHVAPAADNAALRREIEQLNRDMEAAVNRGDLLGAARFYADDAVVRSPSGVVAAGREGIDKYFLSIAPAKSWKLDVIEVGGTSDVAYQVGRSTLVHGVPSRTSVVRFVVVWKRQPDSALRILLDYYH